MNDIHPTADGRLRKPPKDPVFAVIEPALKVGAVCGGAGFLFGGTAGILKSTTPFLFASASGLQTFALGTTFWGCRSTILQAWNPDHHTPSDLTKASAISGGLTGGTVALLVRGRSNAMPGALMFSLFGFLGQTAYNRMSARRGIEQEPKKGFWRRMSEKSWSPITVMTDEEYADMLKEKLLKVEVEISILDDKIMALRKQQKEEQTTQALESSQPEK